MGTQLTRAEGAPGPRPHPALQRGLELEKTLPIVIA